jgi:hypothetical protein
LFDILPTCLDVCGLQYNGTQYKLPGESLCAEASNRNRDYQIASLGKKSNRWVMSRSRGCKYVYWYNGGTEELFDLVEDPGEKGPILGYYQVINYKKREKLTFAGP